MKYLYLGLAAFSLLSMNLEAQSFVAKKESDCKSNEQCCGNMYCEYCKLEPEYFQTYRCEMEAVEVPVQKIRYNKRYFQKECCRMVPEKYYVTQMIQEPEYYTCTEVKYQPKWFVDTHCRMVPKKFLKPVCKPCACETVEAPMTGNEEYYQSQMSEQPYFGETECCEPACCESDPCCYQPQDASCCGCAS